MEIQRSGNTNYMANYRDIIFNSVDEYTRANDNKPVEFNFSSSLKSCNPKLSIIPSYIFPRNVNKNNYSNLYPPHTHTHPFLVIKLHKDFINILPDIENETRNVQTRSITN